jgi:hypothetical protein
MPLHFLCSLELPAGLTLQLDRILRQGLWRDKVVDPKHSLAAWEMVCKPKDKGGLGIVNIQKQNALLLIKFVDKFIISVNSRGCNSSALHIMMEGFRMQKMYVALSGGEMCSIKLIILGLWLRLNWGEVIHFVTG